MAFTDDLKALEELHSKGRLTDQEFAAAKAAAIATATTPSQTAAAAAPAISPTPADKKKASPWPRNYFGSNSLGADLDLCAAPSEPTRCEYIQGRCPHASGLAD